MLSHKLVATSVDGMFPIVMQTVSLARSNFLPDPATFHSERLQAAIRVRKGMGPTSSAKLDGQLGAYGKKAISRLLYLRIGLTIWLVPLELKFMELFLHRRWRGQKDTWSSRATAWLKSHRRLTGTRTGQRSTAKTEK